MCYFRPNHEYRHFADRHDGVNNHPIIWYGLATGMNIKDKNYIYMFIGGLNMTGVTDDKSQYNTHLAERLPKLGTLRLHHKLGAEHVA